MPRKRKAPRWVPVFLKQLERGGNVRLAAEGAGVDYTTAYQRRKRHGEFAEAWEGALAAFAAHSARGEGEGQHALALPQPGAAPSFSPEGRGESVARPDGVVIRLGEGRWGKRSEEAFLLELTVNGSVKLAARAAGFSTTAVYRRRLKDRHFAAAWEAAIETGKARVQAYLVEAATRTFDPDELPIGDDREMAKVSISEAISIAKLKAAGPALAEPEEGYGDDYLKEVRERILDKLARLRERDQEELGEAGWIEWPLPPRPGGSEGGTVWLPPQYRLAGPEATLTGSGQAASTSSGQAASTSSGQA